MDTHHKMWNILKVVQEQNVLIVINLPVSFTVLLYMS